MGFPKALVAHKKGDIDTAFKEYERAYLQNDPQPALYQNFGSLLKDKGEFQRSQEVYDKGLSLHPNHPGILQNYANLLKKEKPYDAFLKQAKALSIQLLAHNYDKASQNAASIVAIFRDIGLHSLAYSTLLSSLESFGLQPPLVVELLLLCSTIATDANNQFLPASFDAAFFYDFVELHLDTYPPKFQIEILLSLSVHKLISGDSEKSLHYHSKALSLLKAVDKLSTDNYDEVIKNFQIQSWNYSNALLKNQNLEEGWKLYDYGLRTPAEGKQRWQRALLKPFSSSSVPMWRGESLQGLSILILEEQAIGDTMMFFTLLPRICQEAKSVTVIVNKRLYQIYLRTQRNLSELANLTVKCTTELNQIRSSPSLFDYQSPSGSICQYRFTDLSAYSPCMPFLQSEPALKSKLILNYKKQSKKIIGLSWRGGAKGRQAVKSIPLPILAKVLSQQPDFVFLSLQYGDVTDDIKSLRSLGIDVFVDSDIDPVRDLNSWISQVDACDAVLSVANTTIHGAGGLNKPTQCLLSSQSDWRWFDSPEVMRSYWYPSVGIIRVDHDQNWDSVVGPARAWLTSGCPLPRGPIASH